MEIVEKSTEKMIDETEIIGSLTGTTVIAGGLHINGPVSLSEKLSCDDLPLEDLQECIIQQLQSSHNKDIKELYQALLRLMELNHASYKILEENQQKMVQEIDKLNQQVQFQQYEFNQQVRDLQRNLR